ncbi:MAG: GHKL domain-containing protein [Lachnospiraceae bacterium]|nr:GHKL domain-containing protein [Lachnospiraceae bacterium]
MGVLRDFAVLFLIVIEYFSFGCTILQKRLQTFFQKNRIWGLIFFICLIGISLGEWRLTVFYGMGKKENAIVSLLSIIAAFWIYDALLGRKPDKEAFRMADWVWLPVAGVMLLLNGLISYFALTFADITGIILIVVGELTIFLLDSVMFRYYNTKLKYQTWNEQQKQYYENLLKKEQDTRQFRHDITAHLLQIQNFCEKGQCTEAEQYIQELLGDITLINKKQYCVGNDMIDTILNTYLMPVAQTCTVKVKGCVNPEMGSAGKALCIIVSNLVQNAVEAVEQSTAQHKEIVFTIDQGKQFLRIRVKNTADTDRIHIRNRYPVTGKDNKRMHGMGIRNVKAAAKAYHGNYQYRIEPGYYIAEVEMQM